MSTPSNILVEVSGAVEQPLELLFMFQLMLRSFVAPASFC